MNIGLPGNGIVYVYMPESNMHIVQSTKHVVLCHGFGVLLNAVGLLNRSHRSDAVSVVLFIFSYLFEKYFMRNIEYISSEFQA